MYCGIMYMKKATCNQLKGACNQIITGNTPEEMGENSKKHVMEMVQKGDEAHQRAMDNMMKMSQEEQNKFFDDFRNSFESLPEA